MVFVVLRCRQSQRGQSVVPLGQREPAEQQQSGLLLMWFHAGLVNPLDNSNRANAFSVRCVQHLLELFFNYIRIGTCGTTCGPE